MTATTRTSVTIYRAKAGGPYHWRCGDENCTKNYMAREQAERSALKAHPDAEIVFAMAPMSDKAKAKSKKQTPQIAAPAKKDKTANPKRVSLLDAAATVLAAAKEPMQAKAIVEQVVKRGLWKPGAGKTPHATLYAAMTREIAAKGKDARFRKVDRGQFTSA